jgi:hypothetical protein
MWEIDLLFPPRLPGTNYREFESFFALNKQMNDDDFFTDFAAFLSFFNLIG